MGQRKAVTRQIALRYQSAGKSEKARILDELCAVTGWHRDHARKALRTALHPEPDTQQRTPRARQYQPEDIQALLKIWAVLNAPAANASHPCWPRRSTGWCRAANYRSPKPPATG